MRPNDCNYNPYSFSARTLRFVTKCLLFFRKYLIEIYMCHVFLLFWLWVFAFNYNGIVKNQFELASVWQGMSAILGMGSISILKYAVDSWKNTTPGQRPDDNIVIIDEDVINPPAQKDCK